MTFGLVLSTEVQFGFLWIIKIVSLLKFINMKKAFEILDSVKTIIVLCAIGAGTLLGEAKYFGCKRIF